MYIPTKPQILHDLRDGKITPWEAAAALGLPVLDEETRNVLQRANRAAKWQQRLRNCPGWMTAIIRKVLF